MTTSRTDLTTDDLAMAALMDEHRAALMSYTGRLTDGDRAWAEDVVQEVFVRAWRHLDQMTPEYGSVRSWLRRVAHNLAVDGHRTRRARPAEPERVEARAEPSLDHDSVVLDSIEVRQALAELSLPHRAVLVELYLRDRSVGEVAHRLGVPVGTVKSRAFYALRQLRTSRSVETCAS